ncbi:YceI family protein [Microbulbifer sp. ANSA005]|uniref:YceI family protein n=1 Tax=Microbulbifer sp. ANSA005 TaxID=3243362 RepID=UPI00404310E3
MKKLSVFLIAALMGTVAQAAEYKIDTKGAHAFVQFRIKHLGYSWLYGRFDDFSGSFFYDEKQPEKSSINVDIDVTSLNSNHAERDKHLRSDDFLDTAKFPTATFKSTSFEPLEDGKARLNGELTLRGITKPITIDVTNIGGGKDPWGGYRQGFSGTTEFELKEFGIKSLGPASQKVEMILDIEGIRI